MNTRLWVRIGLLAFALAAAALLLAWQARGADAVNPAQVAVTLKDFTLTPAPATAPVGDVQFNATNQGALPHEVVVIKTDLAPNALPRRPAVDRVDEAAAGEVIGEIEHTQLGPGQSASAVMTLTAGKYVLICNVEGHYTAAMYSAFTVGAVATATATPTPAPTASPTPAHTPSPAPPDAPTASPAPTAAALPKSGGSPRDDAGFPWVWLIAGLSLIGAASMAWKWPAR